MGNNHSTSSYSPGLFSEKKKAKSEETVTREKKHGNKPENTRNEYLTDSPYGTSGGPSAETSQPSDFKWLEGRKYQNVEGVGYFLPQDDTEIDRLQLQHYIQKLVFEGNYMPPVQELFSTHAKVLDIGCGTGIWLLETATEYPTTECYGIDIANVFPAEIKPVNTHFKIANLLEGLPFQDNEFDFVQMRLLVFSLRKAEWATVLKDIVRVTKPGGWIQLIEADGNVWNTGEAKPFMDRIGLAICARGQDPYVARKLHTILRDAGVVNISRKFVSIPIGWGGLIGGMMLENFRMLLAGGRGFFPLIFGQTVEEYDEECKISTDIMVDSKAYYNWHVAWGQKLLAVPPTVPPVS